MSTTWKHFGFISNATSWWLQASAAGQIFMAFDNLCRRSKARYMESFSAYARSFVGNLERPDVDKINGLSPVISIEQKTTSRNPRPSVNTVTEIYDFFAIAVCACVQTFSYLSGENDPVSLEDQILDISIMVFKWLCWPVVKGRKDGELFVQCGRPYTKSARGWWDCWNHGQDATRPFKIHDTELVVDRIVPRCQTSIASGNR